MGRPGWDQSTENRSKAVLRTEMNTRYDTNCQCRYLRTFRHCQRWRPLLLQNVQADAPIGINVGVVNLRLEGNFRRLERVIDREGDF